MESGSLLVEKKGWNIFAVRSAGIPLPVSVTVIAIQEIGCEAVRNGQECERAGVGFYRNRNDPAGRAGFAGVLNDFLQGDSEAGGIDP